MTRLPGFDQPGREGPHGNELDTDPGCDQRPGGSRCALDRGHAPPCYATAALPAELFDTPARVCRFCHRTIRDGLTNKGNKSVFDLARPHPNHWIGCAGRGAARKDHPR